MTLNSDQKKEKDGTWQWYVRLLIVASIPGPLHKSLVHTHLWKVLPLELVTVQACSIGPMSHPRSKVYINVGGVVAELDRNMKCSFEPRVVPQLSGVLQGMVAAWRESQEWHKRDGTHGGISPQRPSLVMVAPNGRGETPGADQRFCWHWSNWHPNTFAAFMPARVTSINTALQYPKSHTCKP